MSHLVVETPAYRLELRPDGLLAELSAPDGTPLAALRPLAAIDTVAGLDETLAVEQPEPVEGGFVVGRRSTVWERAGMTLVCGDESIELRPWVAGRGTITDVHLLGVRKPLAVGELLAIVHDVHAEAEYRRQPPELQARE